MHIEARHLEIVKSILSAYQYTFYVFGSRAKGQAKNLSDIDLCYFDKIPDSAIMKIEEEFEDSDLPYKVDIVNFNKCDDTFKSLIKRDLKTIQELEHLISK